jgi:hypothetical protein
LDCWHSRENVKGIEAIFEIIIKEKFSHPKKDTNVQIRKVKGHHSGLAQPGLPYALFYNQAFKG